MWVLVADCSAHACSSCLVVLAFSFIEQPPLLGESTDCAFVTRRACMSPSLPPRGTAPPTCSCSATVLIQFAVLGRWLQVFKAYCEKKSIEQQAVRYSSASACKANQLHAWPACMLVLLSQPNAVPTVFRCHITSKNTILGPAWQCCCGYRDQ